MEQFRKTIIGKTHKLQMEYKVQPVVGSPMFKVCRKVFAYCWGITEYEVKKMSAITKSAAGGYATGYNYRPFTESTILGIFFNRFQYVDFAVGDIANVINNRVLGYSVNETEKIFRSNTIDVSDPTTPELFTGSVDANMVRNAITPFSNSQRLCGEWLKNYFIHYGEKSPNGKETKLNQGWRLARTVHHEMQILMTKSFLTSYRNNEGAIRKVLPSSSRISARIR